jgi:DNA invertase Pin-like site-specific DNA recombinase
MTVALYMRVSKGKGQDTRSQEPDLRRWALAQARPEEYRFYVDKRTGKTMDREMFNILLDDIRAGRITTLVVWRIDRLGRTSSGLALLFDELVRLKVNLISLKDGMDLSTPAGRLMAGVIASVAVYETEVRGERVVAGLEARKAAGKKLGPAHGSRTGRRLKVTPERMAAAMLMVAEGHKPTAIARAIGVSRQTVYTMLPKAGGSDGR